MVMLFYHGDLLSEPTEKSVRVDGAIQSQKSSRRNVAQPLCGATIGDASANKLS